MSRKLLIVDDEANMRKILQAILQKEGYESQVAAHGGEALQWLDKESFQVILTDLRMPVMDGMELLQNLRVNHPHIPVIIITAHGTVEVAVEALKKGAHDFITKPFDTEELKRVIAKAFRVSESNARSPVRYDPTPGKRFGIGKSPAIQEVWDLVAKIADSPSTVLVHGESGTGKELVAKALHENSSRKDNPIIKINCGAIPENLLESELFGYEKGAFTSAVTSKPGRFELADKGTLFLDEIGDISKDMQVKLLRALQEQEFERVGGLRSIKVDVRIVAATNKDLAKEVEAGNFRADLYYRLNVVPVRLPPLRDRLDDIPLLAEHFIKIYSKRLKKNIKGVSAEAVTNLKKHTWPGNIRELENLIERAILLTDNSVLQPEDLALPLGCAKGEMPPKSDPAFLLTDTGMSLKDLVKRKTFRVEKAAIERALKETHGNVTRAAKHLQISRKSLQLKMKEYELRES